MTAAMRDDGGERRKNNELVLLKSFEESPSEEKEWKRVGELVGELTGEDKRTKVTKNNKISVVVMGEDNNRNKTSIQTISVA